eukprot:CAMPEP_0198150752 /NCGR_PEP_ID=MMETSP1443-20131203/52293_1 /TAXON_ID=186043 /ORGANISM="Entomoneis sp., Strain CCMP2396" /LENGTH=60 /DNA_ID=CAMNT_0043816163 /DNA_START=42 /DNA_END=221 /DNA_ORIENTATION=+
MAKARSICATTPDKATKRAPEILTAASALYPFKFKATSSCHKGSKLSPSGQFNSLGKACI